ncbi:MAG: DUF393 domain-containing protein [Flavobacteriales bacterium]|nr:DUF393 domain-containing protein [Flavobacteriales bacterium]
MKILSPKDLPLIVEMQTTDTSQQILLFDGVCNLCNAVVQFVLRHDKGSRLSFASLQSAFGKDSLKKHALEADELKTFIYLRNGNAHTRSTAFLYLMRDLGGGFRLLEICWIFPRFLRDAIYNLVSRTRYSIFGKREECYLPTEDVRHRFLDGPSST